ncbi:hypothetical protein ACOSQ2_029116 [Xanthoceras sorbifolium]
MMLYKNGSRNNRFSSSPSKLSVVESVANGSSKEGVSFVQEASMEACHLHSQKIDRRRRRLLHQIWEEKAASPPIRSGRRSRFLP